MQAHRNPTPQPSKRGKPCNPLIRLADIMELLESPSLTGETFAILQREQTKLRRILKTRKEESCTIKPKR